MPVTHVIVIPLNSMFRSMSGSFGSAISGGLFARVLRSTLETDFKYRGLKGKEQLIRQLLGTPALVNSLVGAEKEVAVDGYTTAVKALFVSGSILALIVTVFQAGTGWTAPKADTAEDEVVAEDYAIEPVTSREPLTI
jgi:hypothetical protein